jgi:hypothetical protein
VVFAFEGALVAFLEVVADDVARRPGPLRVFLACDLVSGGMGGASGVDGVSSVAVVVVGGADDVVAGVDGGGCRERKDGGCGKSAAAAACSTRPRG